MAHVTRVLFPIGTKLIAIISLLLLLSLGGITYLVSLLVGQDVEVTAEDNNYNINRRIASSTEKSLTALMAKSLFHLNALSSRRLKPQEERELTSYFFSQNPEIYAIAVLQEREGGNHYFLQTDRDREAAASCAREKQEERRRARAGEIVLCNASSLFGKNVLALFFPRSGELGLILFYPRNLQGVFNTGDNRSYLLNSRGEVLLSAGGGNSLSARELEPFSQDVFNSTNMSRQNLFTNSFGQRYYGAYQKLSLLDAAVITTISYSTVRRSVWVVMLRNIIISLSVLFFAVISLTMYARGIAKPLRDLARAAESIEAGHYDINLYCRRHDEIGILTDAFTRMSYGLENFQRFTNKPIVRLARQGKLTRTGVNKTVTVCFTLIRDFSERMGKSRASEVVDFVNSFFRRMVPCVTAMGGIVDKFLTQDGVVIMSIWGSVESAGSPARDAFNCVKAALMMRASLRCLNQTRRKDGDKRIIKMGCGINTGEVVAGQMGSEERMEYTVIGDAVNLTARIEGPNDAFDTDILITEQTYNLLKRRILTEEMPSLDIKGKSKPLRVYSVINVSRREDSTELFDMLEKVPLAEKALCMSSLGSTGPHTMEEVRLSWEPSEVSSFLSHGKQIREETER